MMTGPSSSLTGFRNILASARSIVVLTGAGVSAESGIATFRGAGGVWRADLNTLEAFRAKPSLVWQFYHNRREVALSKEPNKAHFAIADLQARYRSMDRSVTVITQNIDELHQRAGATDVIELHGSLFKTRCTKCREVRVNHDSPICEALRGLGEPDRNLRDAVIIPDKDLPCCLKESCRGLLRPHIVWFGENLEKKILQATEAALNSCDLCLLVGTSSVVYPAAMFAPQLAERGVPVAEFNLEPTDVTDNFSFHFEGPCGTTLPDALQP